MRVSTNPEDVGYLKKAHQWYVMFNYEFVHDVVTADDVEGEATYITNERRENHFVEKTVKGAVTLFNPFEIDNPEDITFKSFPDSMSARYASYDIKI